MVLETQPLLSKLFYSRLQHQHQNTAGLIKLTQATKHILCTAQHLETSKFLLFYSRETLCIRLAVDISRKLTIRKNYIYEKCHLLPDLQGINKGNLQMSLQCLKVELNQSLSGLSYLYFCLLHLHDVVGFFTYCDLGAGVKQGLHQKFKTMGANQRELLGIRVARSWRVGGDFASKAAQTYLIL